MPLNVPSAAKQRAEILRAQSPTDEWDGVSEFPFHFGRSRPDESGKRTVEILSNIQAHDWNVSSNVSDLVIGATSIGTTVQHSNAR
jgi:hypothetical protein